MVTSATARPLFRCHYSVYRKSLKARSNSSRYSFDVELFSCNEPFIGWTLINSPVLTNFHIILNLLPFLIHERKTDSKNPPDLLKLIFVVRQPHESVLLQKHYLNIDIGKNNRTTSDVSPSGADGRARGLPKNKNTNRSTFSLQNLPQNV